MATHRKSIIKEVLDRLDAYIALEQSRGTFHSHQALYWKQKVFKEHVLAFANWARTTYGMKRIEDLDERIHDLTAEFLRQRTEEGESDSTLHVMRVALGTIFADLPLVQEERQFPPAPDAD